MQLVPKRPPGRSDRKAGAYAAEIVRLRDAGYTFEAIREALAEVGIELTTSVLRREVRRLQRPDSDTRASGTGAPVSISADAAEGSSSPPRVLAAPTSLEGTNGHEIAEAFFLAHPSNPLLRAKRSP
jgi:hypothetical protein